MDARAALLMGTGTAVVLAVAMTCGVALSSASALADRPGTVLHGTAVVVPGSPEPTSTATSSARAEAPETVAAPAPKDIGGANDDAPKTTTPVAGGAETKSSSGSAGTSKSSAEKGASTSDAAKADTSEESEEKDSTTAHRWSGGAARSADDIARFRERMRALVERWEQRQAENAARKSEWLSHQTQKKSSVTTTEESSGSGHPRDRSGSQKGQSHRSPDDRD